MLLTAVILLSPILSACGSITDMPLDLGTNPPENSVADSTEGDTSKTDLPPYTLNFKSNGDGTCSVSISTNPLYTTTYTVEIPEKSPEGDTVVSIDDSHFERYSKIPKYLCIEDFENLKSTLESNTEEQAHAGFLCKKFLSYYPFIDLSTVTDPERQQKIKEDYPLSEYISFYALDISTTTVEMASLAQILDDYTEYSGADHYNDFVKFKKLVDEKAPAELAKTITFANYAENISDVKLPNTLEELSPFALKHCVSLKSVTIPENVSRLNGNAFMGCTYLENIHISENNKTYQATNGCIIEKSTDSLIYATPYVTLTEEMNIKHIKAYAFCNGNTSPTIIPVSVREIEEMAFENCDKFYYLGVRADFAFLSAPMMTESNTFLYYEYPPDANGNYWHYVNGQPTEW